MKTSYGSINPNYKIEKGIPIPQPSANGRRELISKMNVGDSVSFEKSSEQVGFYTTARTLKPRVFTIRKLATGFRIWRVK